jgi:hypothetical protein
MNWEAISTVAEIAGAIGVVASLIFLAFETRMNTKTMRASLSNQVLTAVAELNDVVFADPELRRIVSKSSDPDFSLEDFDNEEREAVIFLARSLLKRIEGVLMLYRQGLVEVGVWESNQEMAAGLIQLPIWQQYWQGERNNRVYSQDFIETMESAVAVEFRTPLGRVGV